MPPVIALLTDFGLRDAYVGAMKGPILSVCPEAALVDVLHEVPAHDVAAGALALEAAYRHFPGGTVFVAIVDAGVGSSRRPLGSTVAQRPPRAAVHRGDCDPAGCGDGCGCGGLDWLFRQVEEAIVLEHDCLPHPSFFPFCEELLERYRRDGRVAGIGGNNFIGGSRRIPHSYYFSRYLPIWGWATWRRTWQTYDVHIRQWPDRRNGRWLYEVLGDWSAVEYWTRIFDRVHRGGIDTWDYQLTFANWRQGALSVVPAVNLVTNIGFGPAAVHTKEITWLADLPRKAMQFPLSHPHNLVRDARADVFTDARVFSKRTRKIRRSLQARLRCLLGAWRNI